MTKRDGDEMRDAAAHATMAELEAELALLVRGLEAVQRRRSYPLERAPYLLIRLITEEGAKSVGEIARRLLLDDSTVTRQVAAMGRDGLIEKRRSDSDARTAVIHVTRKGRELAKEMRAMRFRHIGNLVREWSDAERAEAARTIARLNRSLGDVLATAPDEAIKFP